LALLTILALLIALVAIPGGTLVLALAVALRGRTAPSTTATTSRGDVLDDLVNIGRDLLTPLAQALHEFFQVLLGLVASFLGCLGFGLIDLPLDLHHVLADLADEFFEVDFRLTGLRGGPGIRQDQGCQEQSPSCCHVLL
jgi:hypothetical protein